MRPLYSLGKKLAQMANLDFDVSALTALRTYLFPNYSGTIALMPTLNMQTGTSYTLVSNDENNMVGMNNASANTVTIPLNSTVKSVLIGRYGVGVTTIQAAAGVYINGIYGGSKIIAGQYQALLILQVSSNVYWIPNS